MHGGCRNAALQDLSIFELRQAGRRLYFTALFGAWSRKKDAYTRGPYNSLDRIERTLTQHHAKVKNLPPPASIMQPQSFIHSSNPIHLPPLEPLLDSSSVYPLFI